MDRSVVPTHGWWFPAAGATLALSASLLLGCGASRPTGEPAAWLEPIRAADAALERGDGPGAAEAWSRARVAAIKSRRWEALLEAGDAAARIARVDAAAAPPAAKIREVYLAALFRARLEGSPDGALRVAEAFSALGDDEVVEECLLVADRLARGPEERAQVAAERDRHGPSPATARRVASSDASTEDRR